MHERIGELKALGSCEDVIESVRVLERMQLEDMEKGTRLLLMMKETHLKISENARFILKIMLLGWLLEEIHVTWAHLEKKRVGY
ncbi:hypothetical protein Tco_0490017 [Tanacetum coccineum]